MKGRTLIYAFVIIWAVVFAGSVLMMLNVEGPRSIDTGFKKLDVLVRGQFLALFLALAAGVAGFTVKGSGKRERLIGLVPLGLTFSIVALGLLLLVFIPDGQSPSTPPTRPAPVPTAPAEPAQPVLPAD